MDSTKSNSFRNHKLVLIFFSFVAGAIVSLYVAPDYFEVRHPYKGIQVQQVQIKQEIFENITEFSVKPEQDDRRHGILKLSPKCFKALLIKKHAKDVPNDYLYSDEAVKEKVRLTTSTSEDLTDRKFTLLREEVVPECNNAYVAVAGDTRFVPHGGLPPAKTIDMAISQVQRCANATGASDYFRQKNRTRTVFVMATWRSGSSFFAEALSSHPVFYYYYEPLMYLGQKQVLALDSKEVSEELQEQIDLISSLNNCSYNSNGPLGKHVRTAWNTLALNNKIQSHCASLGPQQCAKEELINGACEFFPVKLFKFTRLRGYAGEELLRTFPGSKLIYLFRDPRGIRASRNELTWCNQTTPCGNIRALCCSLQLDLDAVRQLQQKYPEDVQVVKYEHLALNPLHNFKKVFRNLNIPWHSNVEKYIWLHTKQQNDKPMSTVKIPETRIRKWKSSLHVSEVEGLQNACEAYMKELDYPFFTLES